MEEIAAIPWNGFRVVSTFSGAGGSCLGYRMAGFKVVWANEFVPAAQESYKANSAPDCILDPRDIKLIQPGEVLAAIGLAKGELDLFDGSPPCQAFSTAGKREKGWGTLKRYGHGASQCNETLFDEYIRLLRGLMPKVFVAENVSGLVKGVAKGFFLEILAALKVSGYRVECRVCDAQWLGVPQARQRTIFVGVREDQGLAPVHPSPLPYRYSIRDALPWLGSVKSGPTGFGAGSLTMDAPAPTISASGQAPYRAHGVEVIVGNDAFTPRWGSPDHPTPTIMAGGAHGGSGEIKINGQRRKFTIEEVKALCSFPADFVLSGSYAQQWKCLGNSVPPLMMRAIAETIRDRILAREGRHATETCS
jgi:DNA (cytosine-5)-methyltransferase 1